MAARNTAARGTNVDVDVVIVVEPADVPMALVEHVAASAIAPLSLSHVESSRSNDTARRVDLRLSFTATNRNEAKRTALVATNAVRALVARIICTTTNGV